MIRVLSFDGGGVLGVGPACLLELWERDHGKGAFTLANGFAGTSTGSILAAGLACGISAAELTELYLKRSPEIFKERPWYKRINSHKYEGSGLKKVLDQVFGDRLLGEVNGPLVICASDFKGGEKDGVTDFYTPGTHPGLRVAEAVRRSCSAPTYFPPVDGRYADGGLFANNPSMALVTYLAQLGWTPAQVTLLSFGTGGKHWDPVDLSGRGTASTLKPLVEFVLSAATARVVHRYCETLGLSWYQRLAPDVRSPGLDNLPKMGYWMQVWGREYEVNGRRALADFLRPHTPGECTVEQNRRLIG